jgi:hypothetical protein
VSEFFEAQIRAEWDEWTFGAHQAARRAAATDDLVALRRQYRHLGDEDLARLAAGWRSDSGSGPYFTFAAAALGGGEDGSGDGGGGEGKDSSGGGSRRYAVSATFMRALFQELSEGAADALAGLLALWSRQRRHAKLSGQRPIPVRPPRVVVLIPGDARWPPARAWDILSSLDLEAPRFDRTLLFWDDATACWLAESSG